MHERISPARPFSAEQTALMKKMTQEIEQSGIRAVCFRLEDTLTVMPFSEQYDIFMLMEEQFQSLYIGKSTFTELRIRAQEEAERKCRDSAAVTLALVYDILMKLSKITPDSREKLMKREMELAIYFAYPRRCGYELFGAAKRKKKKTVVVTDSIYPRSVIVNILSHCGYESCDALIVTSELSQADRLTMFETVIKKAGVSADKLMSIGSNFDKDVEKPIVRGSKAMLLHTENYSMVRSGKLRGFIEQKCMLKYDQPEYLGLHCALGIYSDYGFDIMQPKVPLSDFCEDLYMIGFIVAGPLTLIPDFRPEDGIQSALVKAMEECREITAGREDFVKIYRSHFADFIDKFGYEGCSLPLEYLTKHSSPGDKALLEKYLSPADFAEWSAVTEEAEIAPVRLTAAKESAAQKLLDKMFPKGTKVRAMAEESLNKIKGQIFRK